MGKNNKRNRARMPHANSKAEIIQRAREQAAANKPPLTEEETLTLDEARELLVKKEEILREAEQERERILSEISTKKSELHELEETYAAKKETLLLNEEAQSIIDQRNQTLSNAQAEAKKICAEAASSATHQVAQAENTAKELLEKAQREAQTIKANPQLDADSIVSAAKIQATRDAKESIDAAKEEEKAIIDSKVQTATMRANAIMFRADEYEKRVRLSDKQYEQQIT